MLVKYVKKMRRQITIRITEGCFCQVIITIIDGKSRFICKL